MALYVVCAYEGRYGGRYGGLHGIRSSVIEANSEQEAYEYGIDEAWNVVYNYCYNEYEESIKDNEIDIDRGEITRESLYADVYKITKRTNESLEILNAKLYDDVEGFIETYCA